MGQELGALGWMEAAAVARAQHRTLQAAVESRYEFLELTHHC